MHQVVGVPTGNTIAITPAATRLNASICGQSAQIAAVLHDHCTDLLLNPPIAAVKDSKNRQDGAKMPVKALELRESPPFQTRQPRGRLRKTRAASNLS